MKTRAITVAIILGGFSAAISQEYDDVYFSKNDREPSVVFSKKEKEQTAALTVAQNHKKLKSLDQTTSILQATDPAISMEGYTGRTINPDYQPGGVKVTTASYFTPNYQPMGVNSQLNRNTSYASNNYFPYNNYGNSFYGNGFGNYYSPYSSFGCSPYGYGNGFNSAFGGGYYSPYYGGMNSMYSNLAFGMGYGYGSGYYGGGYGGYYPTTVVVVNNPDSHINKVYSKRESRSSYAGTGTTSASRGTVITGDPTQTGRGGRVATASNTNTYYQRGWRQDPTVSQSAYTSGSRSSAFTGGTSSGSRSTWGTSGGSTRTSSWSNPNSSFSTGGTRSTTSFGSGGSTFSGGTSGGSRSSSFSGGGSSGGGSRPSGGGGGGSRGRN